MPSADTAAVRRASPGDADAIARLFHDFQLEFSEPTPGVEALAVRYEILIRKHEMTVFLVGDGPDGFAQLRFRPWVYTDGDIDVHGATGVDIYWQTQVVDLFARRVLQAGYLYWKPA